jgi:hypoxanthine-guanine phosphoribosyltransferase
MSTQVDAFAGSDDQVHNHCHSGLGQTVDFFAASSYGAATVASGDVSVNMAAAKIDVSGRHVLVVSR